MTSKHDQENVTSRKRMADLANRLADEQLAMEMDGGWTVAAYFAHLAFFDRRSLELLRRIKESGYRDSPVDFDVINDALLPQLRLLPPRAAVDDALDAAEAVDEAVAALPAQLVVEILEKTPRNLARHIHRQAHLDELEARFS